MDCDRQRCRRRFIAVADGVGDAGRRCFSNLQTIEIGVGVERIAAITVERKQATVAACYLAADVRGQTFDRHHRQRVARIYIAVVREYARRSIDVQRRYFVGIVDIVHGCRCVIATFDRHGHRRG